jgi:hypothetical protein
MKHLTVFVLFAAVAAAQDPPANPLVTVSKNMYAMAKNNILGSVDKVPDELWSYQPTPESAPLPSCLPTSPTPSICSVALPQRERAFSKGIEKSLKTKAEIVPALKEAVAYCDSAYAKMTDANAR